jgi:hypothetical protein
MEINIVFGETKNAQELNGFIVAEIVEPFIHEKELFVWLYWVDPKCPVLHKGLMKYLEDYGRENGIGLITTVVKNKPEVWQKKYFKANGILMTKRLNI